MTQRKKAIITGGSRGIGAATVIKLAKKNYDISFSYAGDSDEAIKLQEKVKKDYGVDCFIYHMLLEEAGDPEKFISNSIKDLGSVDLLVNNAIRPGLGGHLLNIENDELQKYMDADLGGTIICTREVARYMAKHNIKGNIIFTGSMRATRPMPNSALYSGFKAAIAQLAKCFSLDLAPYNIKVNVVEPGATDVWSDDYFRERGMSEEFIQSRKDFVNCIPLKRRAKPEDIANAIYFLASEEASYITGACLLVDGALSLPGLPDLLAPANTDSYPWGHIPTRESWTWADNY